MTLVSRVDLTEQDTHGNRLFSEWEARKWPLSKYPLKKERKVE